MKIGRHVERGGDRIKNEEAVGKKKIGQRRKEEGRGRKTGKRR
jgi:hypothetical protein